MGDEIEKRFEEIYAAEGEAIKARCVTLKELARKWFLRGKLDSNEQTLEWRGISPADAAKVEQETIGEHTNWQHLGAVLEARKQVS
jgi:hypothetical protein